MTAPVRFGSFGTSVLRTSAPQRAIEFYAALVGWTSVPATPQHTFLQYDAKTVASIHHVPGGQDAWVPHVRVESVEHTSREAIRLGASVVDRTDVPGVARLATLRDTEGATFGLWQPDPHPGAELTDVVGSIWWIELLSNDVPAAIGFYNRLFGWSVRETAFEPFDMYRVFERPPEQEGGLLQIKPEWEVAPAWTTIISVDDCDATMSRACELGGEGGFVHTVPKHGRIGSINDPGNAFLPIRGPVPVPAG